MGCVIPYEWRINIAEALPSLWLAGWPSESISFLSMLIYPVSICLRAVSIFLRIIEREGERNGEEKKKCAHLPEMVMCPIRKISIHQRM